MDVTGHLSPDEFWRHIDRSVDRVRLGADGIRLFGLKGWKGATMIGDWEWADDRLSCAGLMHGTPSDDVSIQINSVVGDPFDEMARAVGRAVGFAPSESDYGNRYREIRDAVPILADDVRTDFTSWGGHNRWWAAGEVDGVSLVIESRNFPVEDIDLIEIEDVDPYLAGWQDHLRTVRGGM
ncbi:hypothetical protein [Rhodococcus sp. 077-4]|uniref:hypothetical protein n=1 Tax=Rhodococcus sp. 077-4 TaxID=2789271 RepID=UPI0039F4C90A